MNLGACHLAMSDTVRSREDGMEGLPPTTPSQPKALSLQLGGNWDLLPPWDAPGSSSLRALYTAPLTPSPVGWATYFQAAELWLGCTVLVLGMLGERLRWHPLFL